MEEGDAETLSEDVVLRRRGHIYRFLLFLLGMMENTYF